MTRNRGIVPARLAKALDNDDGFTLIEVTIGIALSTLIVLLGAMLLLNTTKATNQLVVKNNLVTQSETILNQAVSALGNAQSLGYCKEDQNALTGNISFSTPFSQCQHPAALGSALFSATSHGVCFYAYPDQNSANYQGNTVNQLQSHAPNLECIWVDGQSHLWVTTWQPTTDGTGGNSPTYTSCAPSGANICWDAAPPNQVPNQGAVPTQVALCGKSSGNCPSSILLGSLDPTVTTPWFQFLNGNGTATDCSSLSGTNLQSCLQSIDMVRFDIAVHHTNYTPGAFANAHPSYVAQHTQDFSLNYLAVLRGSVYQQEHAWDAA